MIGERPGLAVLEAALFTNYVFSPRDTVDATSGEMEVPTFQISLSSLLETLQIFGVYDTKDRWSTRDPAYGGVSGSLARGGPAAAFDNRVLGMAGVCRLSYNGAGEPLCITLEETGVVTTCELVTYEPELRAEIPLDKSAITQRIIMRANLLYDAITELSSTSPTRLTLIASPKAPYFTLHSNGPLGSATVEFSKDPQLLETFVVPNRTVNTYKYGLIKGASRAMAMATKVSIRVDQQGVLSLQFLIEVDVGEKSYIDFRFVPFVPEPGDGGEEEDADQDQDEDDEDPL